MPPQQLDLQRILQSALAAEGASGERSVRASALGAQTAGAAAGRQQAAQAQALRALTQTGEGEKNRASIAEQGELTREVSREKLAQNQAIIDRDFKIKERQFKMDRSENDLSNANKAVRATINPTTGEAWPGMEEAHRQAVRIRDGLAGDGYNIGAQERAATQVELSKIFQLGILEQGKVAVDRRIRGFGTRLEMEKNKEKTLQLSAMRQEALGLAHAAVENSLESNLKALELSAVQVSSGLSKPGPSRPYILMMESVGVFDTGQKDLLRLLLTEDPDPEALRQFFKDNGVDRQEVLVLKAFIERQVSGLSKQTLEAGEAKVPSPLMQMIDTLDDADADRARAMGQNAIAAFRNISMSDVPVSSQSGEDVNARSMAAAREAMPDMTDDDVLVWHERNKKAAEEVAERASAPADDPRSSAQLSPLAEITEQQGNPDNDGNEEVQDKLSQWHAEVQKMERDLLISVPNAEAAAVVRAKQAEQNIEKLKEEGLIPDTPQGRFGFVIGKSFADKAEQVKNFPAAVTDFASSAVRVAGETAEGFAKGAVGTNRFNTAKFKRMLDLGGRDMTKKEQKLMAKVSIGKLTPQQASDKIGPTSVTIPKRQRDLIKARDLKSAKPELLSGQGLKKLLEEQFGPLPSARSKALKAERRKGRGKSRKSDSPKERALNEISKSLESGSLSDEDAKLLAERVKDEGLSVEETRREIRKIVSRTGPATIF